MLFERWRLRRHGERCQATVVHVRQAPKIATNDYRRYDFVIDVHPGSGPAARVEVSDTFAITGLKPAAGDVVAVFWDRSSASAVFDLDGDPRYDLKALRAQQDKQHQALLDQPLD